MKLTSIMLAVLEKKTRELCCCAITVLLNLALESKYTQDCRTMLELLA